MVPGRVSDFFSGVDSRVDRCHIGAMMKTSTGKHTAEVCTTLTKRTVNALQSAEKPRIARDAKFKGFGIRIHPSGIKAFIDTVNKNPHPVRWTKSTDGILVTIRRRYLRTVDPAERKNKSSRLQNQDI